MLVSLKYMVEVSLIGYIHCHISVFIFQGKQGNRYIYQSFLVAAVDEVKQLSWGLFAPDVVIQRLHQSLVGKDHSLLLAIAMPNRHCSPHRQRYAVLFLQRLLHEGHHFNLLGWVVELLVVDSHLPTYLVSLP